MLLRLANHNMTRLGGLYMAYFNYYSKKIYYKIYGQGVPLIMLHGDSASSKMFQYLISLYVILKLFY